LSPSISHERKSDEESAGQRNFEGQKNSVSTQFQLLFLRVDCKRRGLGGQIGFSASQHIHSEKDAEDFPPWVEVKTEERKRRTLQRETPAIHWLECFGGFQLETAVALPRESHSSSGLQLWSKKKPIEQT
jgi:hypothetical protein